jgi:glycine cleavage system H protein
MTAPSDRRYLESHEWHKADGQTVTIGITQFAADELTDITFVQLPKVGTTIAANQPFGEIESVKATSDLISGISGEVIAVNEQLNAKPGLVNEDPYEKGWIIKVKASDAKDVGKLLSSDDYMKTRH